MDDRQQETLAAKRIWGGAAVFLVVLVALCAKADPKPNERIAVAKKSEEARCERPMDSVQCLEQHNLERRRERMVEQMRDEGLIE